MKAKKNLKLLIIFISILAFAFLMGGILLVILLRKAESRSLENEITNTSNYHSYQITKQFEADFQTLNTLKSFVKLTKEPTESLVKGLNESTDSNKFIRISLIFTDDEVYHITVNDGIKQTNFNSLNEYLQESLKESWKGKDSVSKIFYDTDLEKSIIAISVPIIEDDKIVGVLAAYTDALEYVKLLDDGIKFKSYLHIISDTGEYLIRSKKRIEDENTESIFSMSVQFLDESEVRNALEQRVSYFSTFTKDGTKYCVYFLPMQYYNWYLVNITPYYSIQSWIITQLNYSTLIYGVIILIVGIFTLYSYRIIKRNYAYLENMAYHDKLTGALSLGRFNQIMKETINNGLSYTLLRLNIRNFQLINDTFGEKYADELLCFIASTIEQGLRDKEYCCRENADQFAVLIQGNDKQEIITRINRCEKNIKKFFTNANSSYEIQFGVGVCTEGEDYKQMMSNALWAMKKAKELNETYIFFDTKLLLSIKLQNLIESSMYTALKENEFKLFLQPKYDINQNQIIGAEALVRWIKSDGSIIYPGEFIPIFEKNGFCIELDLYMIELICKTLRDWLDKGYEVYPISVNQTKLLFYKSDYVDKICGIVSKYNISPSYLVLEVLEGLALYDTKIFNQNLEKLHLKGFRVSLDDFGSGYSSLSNLNDLNVDEIKIDKKFLDFSGDDSDVEKISLLENIISLVTTLGCDVVVEGVETKKHVEILRDMDCKFAQGFYFSKPISTKEYEDLFKKVGYNNS